MDIFKVGSLIVNGAREAKKRGTDLWNLQNEARWCYVFDGNEADWEGEAT